MITILKAGLLRHSWGVFRIAPAFSAFPPSMTVKKLLDVLDLLAHLLDQHLDFNAGLRNVGVNRLGTYGVGLAIQFLHQEIELAATGARPREYFPNLG